MQQLTNQERLRPWSSFLLAAIALVAIVFAGSYMQLSWGIWGLLTTELMLLLLAIVHCLIFRVSLKEVFPIRRVTGREFGGVLVFLLGGYGASMIAVAFSMWVLSAIWPASLNELTGLSNYLYGGNSLIVLLPLAAILPAICEEALMRGAILSGFRSWKRDWAIILVVGILFGVFHTSAMGFLSTAFLGMILAYLMVKRNNILLPMLLHFFNNLIAVILGSLSAVPAASSSAQLITAIQPTSLLGVYLFLGCGFPLLLVLGAKLISPETHKKRRFLWAGLLTGVLLFAGVSLILVSAVQTSLTAPIVQSEMDYTVTDVEDPAWCTFDVTEENTYTVSVSITGEGEYTFVLTGPDGEEQLRETAVPPFTLERQMLLRKGSYRLDVLNGEGTLGAQPKILFVVR